MKTGEKKTSAIDNAVEILRGSEGARGSTNYLFLMYMALHLDLVERIGLDSFEELRKIMSEEMPSFETIRKAKQRLKK